MHQARRGGGFAAVVTSFLLDVDDTAPQAGG
jgi:hypothetical protein